MDADSRSGGAHHAGRYGPAIVRSGGRFSPRCGQFPRQLRARRPWGEGGLFFCPGYGRFFRCLAVGSCGYVPPDAYMLESSEPRPRTAFRKLLRRTAGIGGVLAFLASGPAWAQMPGAAPPAVGVVPAKRQPITQSTDYTGRIQATNRVNLTAARLGLPRRGSVQGRRGGQEGRPALPPRAGSVPGRRPGQAGGGRPVQGPAPERPDRAGPQPDAAQGAGRPAIRPSTSALANATGAAGAGAGRRGAASAVADQSRLHRYPRADRRQDRPHRGDRRQYVSPSTGVLVIDRQPGSDVCRLPGADSHRDRAAPAQRREAASTRS